MKSHLVQDVFTPSTAAKINYVERRSLTSRLRWALDTQGMQIVVYGHSGSGKTTLLKHTVEQSYSVKITTRCTSKLTYEQVLADAFRQLGSLTTSEQTTSQEDKLTLGTTIKLPTLESRIENLQTDANTRKEVAVVQPQATIQHLGEALGALEACWILEDFHKINESEKTAIAQSMKVFMDLSEHFPRLKIVAVGAVDTAREVINYDADMRHRVAEIEVPLMEPDEIRSIITTGENLLNVSFTGRSTGEIVQYSCGLASICHNLCLIACRCRGIHATETRKVFITPDMLEQAVAIYFQNSSDTLKSSLQRALYRARERQYDNGRIVLKALCNFSDDGAVATQLLSKIHEEHPAYPAGNLNGYLRRLALEEHGGLIESRPIGNRWAFKDPLTRSFVMAYFQPDAPQVEALPSNTPRVIQLLIREFKNMNLRSRIDDDIANSQPELIDLELKEIDVNES